MNFLVVMWPVERCVWVQTVTEDTKFQNTVDLGAEFWRGVTGGGRAGDLLLIKITQPPTTYILTLC